LDEVASVLVVVVFAIIMLSLAVPLMLAFLLVPEHSLDNTNDTLQQQQQPQRSREHCA
jgi:hypothetical protein